MARLRHLAITVPGLKRVGTTDWEGAQVAAMRRAIEAADGKQWMGEPADGGGFYEVKYHDPDGIAFDITANGWGGAAKS